MTTYEQRILGKQPKTESVSESILTGVLMLTLIIVLSIIFIALPHAL